MSESKGGGTERLPRRMWQSLKHGGSHSVLGHEPILSCVVDTASGFQTELLRWFLTATECAGIAAERIVIHAIRPGDSDVIRLVEERGAHVTGIEPFDERSPHCNKIAGALSLAQSLPGENTPVALLDTDMLVMADPTTLKPRIGCLAGKRVDLANPPLDILNRVFGEAGLAPPPPLPGPEPTLLGNLNGGLYVLNGCDLKAFATGWSEWAHWMLDRSSLLGAYAVHVDQVAACLAIADLNFEVQLVDLEWNVPTHLHDAIPVGVDEPNLIHYHRCVSDSGLVEMTGNETIDRAITRANTVVENLAPGWLGIRP